MIIMEIGLAVQSFDNPLTEGSGSVTHETEEFSYRVTGGGERERGRATALVTNLRAGMGTRFGIYGAVEVELGGLVREPDRRAEMTTTGIAPSVSLLRRMVKSSLPPITGIIRSSRIRQGVISASRWRASRPFAAGVAA